MRTDCIVKLSKLQISELNTLVEKETIGDVEGKPPPSDTPPQRGYPAEAVKENSVSWASSACCTQGSR
jgi:hypothetical protein